MIHTKRNLSIIRGVGGWRAPKLLGVAPDRTPHPGRTNAHGIHLGMVFLAKTLLKTGRYQSPQTAHEQEYATTVLAAGQKGGHAVEAVNHLGIGR